MATDGVKIIDGDYAHDVYHTFMDLYDTHKSLEEIKDAVEQLRNDNDEFDEEIFITVYALALWEIGELTPSILQEVKQAIKRGAFVNYLIRGEGAITASRQRQQVLERFWEKISLTNPRPRKRKFYKVQKKFVFEPGDILTFQLPSDGIYCVAILLLISQYRGRCEYYFIMHDYVSEHKPTMDAVLSGKVFASDALPGSLNPRLGFCSTGVGHKHLLKFAEKLEHIGQLPIIDNAKCLGAQGGAIDFESFCIPFRQLQSGSTPYRAKKYSLKNLL